MDSSEAIEISIRKGKYNIGSELRSDCKLTLSDLAREIWLENDKDDETDETVYKLLDNARGTGVINHLKSKIGFDKNKIDMLSLDNRAKKFAWLKLVKLLYRYEKQGVEINRSKRKFPIIELLSEPCMENIQTSYSFDSAYGKISRQLEAELEKEISDYSDRLARFGKMYLDWQVLQRELMPLVISDYALKKSAECYALLVDYKLIFEERLCQLKQCCVEQQESRESILETFYNIMRCHAIKCLDNDLKKIDSKTCDNKLVYSYISKYRSMVAGNNAMPWDMLKLLEKISIEGKSKKVCKLLKSYVNNDEQVEELYLILKEILWMITYGDEIDEIDRRAYNVAFKHCKTLVSWRYEESSLSAEIKNEAEEFVNLDVVIPAIQEIVYVFKHDLKIKNIYKGNKHPEKTMLSHLKLGDGADAIAKKEWINRTEKRVAYNLGMMMHMDIKEEIDNCFLEFKNYIFSFFDLNDIEMTHNAVVQFIRLCLRGERLKKIEGVSKEDIDRLNIGILADN